MSRAFSAGERDTHYRRLRRTTLGDERDHEHVRPAILRKLCSLIYRLLFKLVRIATGIELPCEAVVGRNFVIDHFGGVIISGYASFGDNCRIRNGVVVGLRRMEESWLRRSETML